MITQSALDRAVRTLVISVGVGSVLFTVLGIPGIIEQSAFLDPVYTVVAVTLFCGLPPVMAIVANRTPALLLRILAGAHAAITLALLVLWVPAMTDPQALYGEGLPWIINTVAVATSLAAIALPTVAGWAYLLAATVLSGVVRYITFGDPDPLQAIQDSVMMLLLSGFMLALIQLALLAGKEQDVAAKEALDAAIVASSAGARARQRARYHSETRDGVVAVLQAAANLTPDWREYARQSAHASLIQISQLGRATPKVVTVNLEELDAQLRTAAIAHGISYASSLSSPGAPLEISVEVADAVNDALTEAMVNSNTHAGWRDERVIHRTVRASREARGFTVVIKDDGRGFDPRRVPIDRLGMRLNILERLNAILGASATVVSSRGRGTTVTLEWNADRNEK